MKFNQPQRFGAGTTDPLGLDLQQRAKEYHDTYARENPMGGFQSGPLYNPQWDSMFQAMDEEGVEGVKGGPSPAGSNQFVGRSVQPGPFTLTSYGQAPGQIPPSVDSLKKLSAGGGGTRPSVNAMKKGL